MIAIDNLHSIHGAHMAKDILDLILHPNRAAGASIHGHLYQACVGVERWLALRDGQTLICEGNEDLDLHGPENAYQSEQVKASGKLDQSEIRPILRHFVETFHRHTQAGAEPRLVLTATADRPERLRLAGARGDVLAIWQDDNEHEAVVDAVRAIVTSANNVPGGVTDALAWLDAAPPRWRNFLAAVDWRFRSPGLEAKRARVADLITARPDSPTASNTLIDRLVVAVLEASTRANAASRTLDVAALTTLLDETKTQLDAWGTSTLGHTTRSLFNELPAIEQLLKSNRLALRNTRQPGHLLTAAFEIIPFDETNRGTELNDLASWCDSDDAAAVRLYTGEGGQGKTRLMIEYCQRQAKRGWHGGFLRDDDELKGRTLDALWSGTAPKLMVVDYAETRPDTVATLLKGIENRHDKHPVVRVVLLSRHEADWWQHLSTRDAAIANLLATATVELLPTLVPETESRDATYRDVATAFAAILDRPLDPRALLSNLDEPRFARALYLHMAALLAAHGEPVASAEDALVKTVEHERRFWRGVARQATNEGALRDGIEDDIARCVAVLTLVGGAGNAEDAGNLVDAAALLPSSQPHLRATVLNALSDLYPGTEDRFLDPLLPDLLGEAHVRGALGGDSSLLDRVLDACDTDQARNALTLLTRIAREPTGDTMPREVRSWLKRALAGRLDDLALIAVDVAVQSGDPIGVVMAGCLGEEGSLGVVEAVMNRCDDAPLQQSVPLREVAMVSTQRVYETRRESWPEPTDDQRMKLARLANNLGNRLNELGHREDALSAAQEAVDTYRALAENRPDAFLPDLASSINNLGTILSELGRREDALSAAQEAVDTYRALAENRPDAFLPDLASSINNLGNRLSELGRREDALSAAQEAVGVLSAPFLGYPPAFAHWMTTMVGNYLRAAEAAGVEPETDLLGPIAAALDTLRASDDVTAES